MIIIVWRRSGLYHTCENYAVSPMLKRQVGPSCFSFGLLLLNLVVNEQTSVRTACSCVRLILYTTALKHI